MNTTTTKPDLLSDTDERAFQALDTAIALAYTADLDDPELAAEHRNAIDAAGHLRARLSDYQANGYEAAPKMTAKEAMRVVRGLMSSSGLGDDESNEALAVLADLAEECERLRGALKILDDYFGGATFDSAIFGTDDGGPIDEAREKLQKSWDCLRSLILAPATAAVGVTREWVQKEILDALRICGREDIDIVCHALREKGIIVEEGEETMTNFDATISLLRELLKDELEILKPSDHSQLESAIHILEAARGVDKEVAWGELADSDIVHGLDGGLYDLLAALPDKEKP